jgi:hypothetical protein
LTSKDLFLICFWKNCFFGIELVKIEECDIHWWWNMHGFKTILVVLVFEEVMLWKSYGVLLHSSGGTVLQKFCIGGERSYIGTDTASLWQHHILGDLNPQ